MKRLKKSENKDITASKNYIDDQIANLCNAVEVQNCNHQKEVKQLLHQFRIDQDEKINDEIEALKRELKEWRYTINANSENIEEITNSIMTIKRREESAKDGSGSAQSDHIQFTADLEKRVDQKIEDKLLRIKLHIKNEVQKENNVHIEEAILDNNNSSFVIPAIEKQISRLEKPSVDVDRLRDELSQNSKKQSQFNDKELEDKCEKVVLRRVETEWKRILYDEVLPNLQAITESNSSKMCKSMINHEVPNICKDIMETEVRIACREVVEKVIEPTWKHLMIEEYSRTRRNIVEKEIHPTWHQIIDEEVPALWKKLISESFAKERSYFSNESVYHACRSVIDQTLPSMIREALSEQHERSKKSLISCDIEPIWREIIKDEIENKWKALVEEDIESIWKEKLKNELEAWLLEQNNNRFHRHHSPPSKIVTNKSQVR